MSHYKPLNDREYELLDTVIRCNSEGSEEVFVNLSSGYDEDFVLIDRNLAVVVHTCKRKDRESLLSLLDQGILWLDESTRLGIPPEYGKPAVIRVYRPEVVDKLFKYRQLVERDVTGAELIGRLLSDGVRIKVKLKANGWLDEIQLETNSGHPLPFKMPHGHLTIPPMIQHDRLKLSATYLAGGFRLLIKGDRWDE